MWYSMFIILEKWGLFLLFLTLDEIFDISNQIKVLRTFFNVQCACPSEMVDCLKLYKDEGNQNNLI